MNTPLSVGSRKQLFIDERFIQERRGVELVVNRPRLTREKLIGVDKPWEDMALGGYTSVIQEGERIHLWYEVMDRRTLAEGHDAVAYAYSTDGGATWHKPELGIVEYEGSRANNLVLRGVCAMHVFLNRPDAPPSAKYAMFVGVPNQCFVSPDGLHWTPHGSVPFLDPAVNPNLTLDSQNVVFWDARLGRYVSYPRLNVPNSQDVGRVTRTFGYASSPILGDFGRHTLSLAPDAEDPADFDFYTTAAMAYPWAEDIYLMFPAAYGHIPPPPRNDGPLDIQFAASRDGVHWLRPDRRPVIPLGLWGDWDGGSLYAGYGLSRQGNELSLYYTGYDVTHGAYVARGYLGGVFARAIYRLDGFMSLDAGYAEGEFTTPRLEYAGQHLELNIDVAAGGSAAVELLDAEGRPIPGFAQADADTIIGNHLAKVVTWTGVGDLGTLSGRPLALRLVMRDCKLYAFQFTSQASGSET